MRFRRDRLELPDGDFLDLDFPEVDGERGATTEVGRPLVLVLHGLEGSARSGYALETYRALEAHGVRAVGLNFRSCSGEPNRTARSYHSGETGDLGVVLGVLRGRFPNRPLGVIGYSLGGNVLLKYLGERGPAAPVLLLGAAVVSVPFDLAAGAHCLERGVGHVYAAFFLRSLRSKLRAKFDVIQGRCDWRRALRAQTMREFDEAATAPLHGFRDADDYYRRSSSGPFLPTVRVPTLLVHADDDPFLPGPLVPRETIRNNRSLVARFSGRGGHVGFVTGRRPWAARLWAEWEAARFVAGRLRETTAAMPEESDGLYGL